MFSITRQLTLYFFVLHPQLIAEVSFDVLCVADMYLLPGLKRLCGKTLAKTICEDNVLYMWKTAKLFRLSRLEDQCTQFMAKIIERVGVRLFRVVWDEAGVQTSRLLKLQGPFALWRYLIV